MATKRRVSELLERVAYSEGDDDEEFSSKRSKSALSEQLPLSYQLYEKKKREALKKRAETQQLGSYAPWSKVAFLGRLQTFSYKHWDVPLNLSKISPVECARLGWTASDRNRLTCTRCARSFVVLVGDSPAVQRRMQEKYGAMIVSEHADSCQWKKRGSPHDIYDLVLTRSAQVPALKKRYESLMKYKELLRNISLATPIDVDALWGVISRAAARPPAIPATPNLTASLAHIFDAPMFGTPTPASSSSSAVPDASPANDGENELFRASTGSQQPADGPPQTPQKQVHRPEASEHSEIALQLAITGWQAASEQADPSRLLVTCDQCFRRVFVAKGLDTNNTHLSYCSYFHNEGKPGWRAIYDLLLRSSGTSRDTSRASTPTPPGMPKSLGEEEHVHKIEQYDHKKRLSSLRSLYFNR